MRFLIAFLIAFTVTFLLLTLFQRLNLIGKFDFWNYLTGVMSGVLAGSYLMYKLKK